MGVFKKLIEKLFPKAYRNFRAYRMLISNEASYLHEAGWMKSLELSRPVDKSGNELPWMNFPVVSFVSKRLSKEFSLFEFGSGYSTSFYAKLVGRVKSVEYDEKWYSIVKSRSPDNVELVHRAEDVDGRYCRSVSESGEAYDVIVVDGRDRVNCIKQSVFALSDRGVIILDDSQRISYLPGVEYLLNLGFSTVEFEGLKATGNKLVTTTIFYRDNNCLKI